MYRVIYSYIIYLTTLRKQSMQYSYKVYVDKQPELCVFAKLSFEYALWNPDKTSHYDLQRTGERIVCIVVSYMIYFHTYKDPNPNNISIHIHTYDV